MMDFETKKILVALRAWGASVARYRKEIEMEYSLSKAPGFKGGQRNCHSCAKAQFSGGPEAYICKDYGVKFEGTLEASEHVCDSWEGDYTLDDEKKPTRDTVEQLLCAAQVRKTFGPKVSKDAKEEHGVVGNDFRVDPKAFEKARALARAAPETSDGWKAQEPGPWLNPCEAAEDRAKVRANAIWRQVREEREQLAKGETSKKPFLEDGYEEAVAYANALAQSCKEDPSDKSSMLLELMEANRRVGIFRRQIAEDKLRKRWEKEQKEGPWHKEWVVADCGARVRWDSVRAYWPGMGDVTFVATGCEKAFQLGMNIKVVDFRMGKWREKEE